MLDPTYFFPSFSTGNFLSSGDPQAEAAPSQPTKDEQPADREEESETPVATSLWRFFRASSDSPPPAPPCPTPSSTTPSTSSPRSAALDQQPYSTSTVPPAYVAFLETLLGRPLVPLSKPAVEAKRQQPASALPEAPDDPAAPDAAQPPASASASPPASTPSTPRHRSSKRRRRRNRRRSSGEDGQAGASVGATTPHEAPAESVKVDSSALPDDVLLGTFRNVMSTGLPVVVNTPADAPAKRALLSVDADGVLRWGKSKRDRLRFEELASVDDLADTLDFTLAATSGRSVRVGASSHMEKALLLRCFGLLLTTDPPNNHHRWWVSAHEEAAAAEDAA